MFVVLMFTLLPLYYSDNYYNILHDKRDVYGLFALILAGILVCSLLVSFCLTIRHKQLKENIKKEFHKTSALDIAMILFGIVAVVSTVYSSDVEQSLTGEAAWDVGTLMIVCSVFLYFAISRCYSGKGDIWAYLYCGTLAVLVIGVIDRLGYDFLVMHDEIPLQYNIFISTIGNINFWAAYLSVVIPFFILAPGFIQGKLKKLCIYLLLLIAYFSLFITLTNTTYLGIGVAMLFVIWYSLQKTSRLMNLAINGILFTVAGVAAEVLWRNPYTPRPIDTDTVTLLILQHHLYLIPGAVGIIIIVFLLVTSALSVKARKKVNRIVERYFSKIWIELILIGVIGLVYYLIYNYSLELFNYRGSIWYFAFNGFLDGNIWQKIMGVGPGLLDTVTQAQIAKADFYVEWNWFYCTAHNDLLEYLVTTGIVGTVLKLLMYILPYIMYARGKSRKSEKAAVLATLTGFIGQGLMTGPYILTYAFYTIFLGVMAAYDRMDKAQ